MEYEKPSYERFNIAWEAGTAKKYVAAIIGIMVIIGAYAA